MEKNAINQHGAIHTVPLLLLVAAVGLISYLLVSSTAPFRSGLFNATNPKPASNAAAITTPLKQSAINPNWFVDGNGKPVVLTGSHTWNNLQDFGANGQIVNLDFNAYVNMMTSHNQNFTLLWRIEMPHFCNLPTGSTSNYDVSPQPYMRTGPGTATDGKPKFDLTKFDQTYFDRLRSRVQQLGANGIYAGVYLFTGEFVNVYRCGNDGYPYTGANNINGVDDGGGNASITMTAPNAITAYQDALTDKTVDTLNDLPNVLWIGSEESGGSGWWNNHVIDHVKAYEATKPVQHPVGNADGSDGSSNADWVAPYDKISPSTYCGNGNPKCKVDINDSDHSYFGIWNDSSQVERNYFWENFVQGDSVIFMDPWTTYYPRENRNLCLNQVVGVCSAPDPRWDMVRLQMGYIRSYGDRMNLLAMHASTISSTTWALVNNSATGFEALIYQPNSGAFTVNLSATTRTLNLEWFNPATGTKTTGSVNGGSSSQSFTPPFSGDAVLYLVDSGGTSTPTPTPVPTPTPTPTPTPAPGTPVLRQSNSVDSSGTSTTISYSNGVTSGDLLLAAVRIGNNTASATVTDNNGNTWTRIDRQADAGSGGGNELELWYAANAKNSPNVAPTLTVNSTISATIRVVVEEFNNIVTTNPLDQHAITAGNSTMPMVSTPGNTSQPNELSIGYAETENGDNYTVFGGYTVDKIVATKLITEYLPLNSVGLQVPMFTTNSSQNWAMGVATFKAVSGTSTPSPIPTPTPGTCPKASLGDTDCDGVIGIFDFNNLVTNFNKTGVGISGGDLDGNGKVDIFDFNTLVTNFGH